MDKIHWPWPRDLLALNAVASSKSGQRLCAVRTDTHCYSLL